MANDPCDYCHQETATITQTDKTTGDSVYIGPDCLPLLGMTLIASMPPELLDPALNTLGYQPKKALRDQRKAEADAAAAELAAAAPSEPSPAEPDQDDGMDECPVCGALVADADGLQHMQTEHPEIVSMDDLEAAIAERTRTDRDDVDPTPDEPSSDGLVTAGSGAIDDDPPPY